MASTRHTTSVPTGTAASDSAGISTSVDASPLLLYRTVRSRMETTTVYRLPSGAPVQRSTGCIRSSVTEAGSGLSAPSPLRGPPASSPDALSAVAGPPPLPPRQACLRPRANVRARRAAERESPRVAPPPHPVLRRCVARAPAARAPSNRHRRDCRRGPRRRGGFSIHAKRSKGGWTGCTVHHPTLGPNAGIDGRPEALEVMLVKLAVGMWAVVMDHQSPLERA
jgi:hypothetical protein